MYSVAIVSILLHTLEYYHILPYAEEGNTKTIDKNKIYMNMHVQHSILIYATAWKVYARLCEEYFMCRMESHSIFTPSHPTCLWVIAVHSVAYMYAGTLTDWYFMLLLLLLNWKYHCCYDGYVMGCAYWFESIVAVMRVMLFIVCTFIILLYRFLQLYGCVMEQLWL